MDLRGEIALADHRGQQPGQLGMERVLDPRLQLDPARFARGPVGQQTAVLVDHFDRIERETGHRPGNQVDDRSDLALRKLPPARETQHDRSRGGRVFADESRFLGFAKMDPDRLDPVDFRDRQHQFAFARGVQPLAFQRAAGPKRN